MMNFFFFFCSKNNQRLRDNFNNCVTAISINEMFHRHLIKIMDCERVRIEAVIKMHFLVFLFCAALASSKFLHLC